MTRHKCFISFKFEDKTKIQANKNIDMIDKSLNEPIDSDNPDYVMQKIRDDNLKDSSVTIFLIGSVSAEIIGEKEQYYIKKELQASLYHSLNQVKLL
ncbi:TIR domain-containing protein [Limosilactobacillus fermentum]|uniref:TIR domain-containing protein n=1 Tax=Limosilactobacillus fermentum TaxID=1613 RepID=UPI0031638370